MESMCGILQYDRILFLGEYIKPRLKNKLNLFIEALLILDLLMHLLHNINCHHLKSHSIKEADVCTIDTFLLCEVF